MSTYFSYACMDCKTEMALDNQRSENALICLLESRELLVKWANEIVLLDVRMAGGSSVDLDWFVNHAGHRVMVSCEYETFDAMEKRFATHMSWRDYTDAGLDKNEP